MFEGIHLPLILVAALMASASPGPATLAIANMSMNSGRTFGLVFAAGVTTGSLIWSVSAALGVSAIMLAHVWAFEIGRYAGASYLLYLAYKSLRSAISPAEIDLKYKPVKSKRTAYANGLLLHLTNPKAILFFGSLFAVGVPAYAPPSSLVIVICAVGLQSIIVFHSYALLFSSAPIVSVYKRLKRWFEGAFAIAFGLAGVKILTTRID